MLGTALFDLRVEPGGGGGALPLLKVGGRAAGHGMIFTIISIGIGYLNRPNWLLAGYSVYHRVVSQGFPAHNVYDRPLISAPATVRAGRPRVYDRPAAALSAYGACGTPGVTQKISSFSCLFTKTGSIRGVQYCNRVCIWKFLVRYIVTGCTFRASSGLWQDLVFNPQRHPLPSWEVSAVVLWHDW